MVSQVIQTAVYIIAFFCHCSIGAAAYVYVVELNTSLDFVNVEHIKLLNGMHEGLLILDDLTKKENEEAAFMFCNKNAKKLLNNYIAKVDDDSKSALHEQGFLPVVLEGIKSSLSFSNRKD